MRRTAIHRLVVTAVMAATLGGYAAPAVAVTQPTAAKAAALVKGEVYTYAAATHRAKQLFSLVRVPALAVLEKGMVAPGTPTPDSLDADLYTATIGHWWLTRGSRTAVAAWLVKHPPVGFSLYASGSSNGSKTLLFQPVSTKTGCCTLEATIDLAGKHTAVNMAAFVQWQPLRARAEHIPVSTTQALLEVGSDPTQTIPSFPNTSVTVSGAALVPLITTLNEADRHPRGAVALPVHPELVQGDVPVRRARGDLRVTLGLPLRRGDGRRQGQPDPQRQHHRPDRANPWGYGSAVRNVTSKRGPGTPSRVVPGPRSNHCPDAAPPCRELLAGS